ncbi:MAG: MFS transporter, partial [Desulfarculaceae bacterium]|nr:MFS transporter [Desulfarculaceae bacterium]
MSAATVSRPSSYRWLVFVVLACAYLLVYFHRTCPAVVAADLMRDLKAGATSLGMLGAAYFYPYALMQLPAGLLSDTWGPRKTITLFFPLAGVGAIWLGLAGSIGPAFAARTLVGLGV